MTKHICGFLLVLLLVVSYWAASPAWAADAFVWWEGEESHETNFPKNLAVTPQPEWADLLSGGNWLGAWGNRFGPTLLAKYSIRVPKTASYHFWARKFRNYGPFRWRFDKRPWRECNRMNGLFDRVQLRPPLCVNWVYLGKVELEAGTRVFHLENTDAMSKEPEKAVVPATSTAKRGATTICLDCFVLSEKPFVPRGKLKPGEKHNLTEDGWFAFEPDADSFQEDAILDLRFSNHGECGEQGYLTTDGARFAWAKNGKPVSFWGTCVGRKEVFQGKAVADYFARRLAKMGCNMVRLHGAFHDIQGNDPLGISDVYVDKFNYFVAALKREGVYLMLNTYYDHWLVARPEYNMPGYKQGQIPRHFQFIHPRGQEIWRSWVKRLLTAKNPYTGMINAEDPTIAIIQIVNEDNYFFHTFAPYKGIPAAVMHVLEKRFGDWLVRKYGSLERAQKAWGKEYRKVEGDAFGEGRVGLCNVWLLTTEAAPHRRRAPRRYWDQTQFLTEDLRTVLGQMQTFLKKELGYKGLVNGGNWLTADPRVLGPLDKYANAICDVMDRHGAGFNSKSILANFYKVVSGDRYVDGSPLLDPENVPLTEILYGDKPHIVSEPKSTMPNRYRAEWFPLQAAYYSLQGVDAVMHFAGTTDWRREHARWSMDTPATMGQCPATALMYRNHYLKEGATVTEEALKLADLYELRGAALTQSVGMDEMTEANVRKGAKARIDRLSKFDPLSFFVGRVVRRVAEAPGKSAMVDLKPYIDRKKEIIKSVTGELTWDWGSGVLKIDAPCAQGVVGFLENAGRQALSQVSIDCQNHYASILVVSLDGKPLTSSNEILLQVMTEDKNYGWKTRPVKAKYKNEGLIEMKEIVSTGRPPILVRNVMGSVVLQRSDAESLKVVALDFNGYGRKELPGGGGGRIRIELLPDCFYYVLRKRSSEAGSKPSPRQESEFRTWTSSDGRFTVEAKLIRAVRGVIYLQRKDDGRQIEVPIGSISQKDREFIQSADG